MLQIALFLLGCALTRYLWEIDVTVASVVLAITSIGILFYFFIVVAGTMSESCPYQTPGSRFLRHIIPHTLRTLRSAPSVISIFVSSKFSTITRASYLYDMLTWWWSSASEVWDPAEDLTHCLISTPIILIGLLLLTVYTVLFMLPVALIGDSAQLVMVVLRLPVTFGRVVYRRFIGTTPQTHVLDLQCISWMLQTSLDKSVHLLTLRYLESLMSIPTDFDSALVACCFNAFVSCTSTGNREVTVMQGLEQLATVSALCFFHTISHLSITDPTSHVLKDINQRYAKVFPTEIDFHGHGFSHTMGAIRRIFIRDVDHHRFTWNGYRPASDEHIMVSQALVKLAQYGYQRTQRAKVSRLILRFALHSLSLYPLPPTPTIADCISIIAIDLDCDVSNTEAVTLDERCVYTS